MNLGNDFLDGLIIMHGSEELGMNFSPHLHCSGPLQTNKFKLPSLYSMKNDSQEYVIYATNTDLRHIKRHGKFYII